MTNTLDDLPPKKRRRVKKIIKRLRGNINKAIRHNLYDTIYPRKVTIYRGKKFVYRPRPKQVLIPIIRFVMPNLIARDIMGAQDMTADYNDQN